MISHFKILFELPEIKKAGFLRPFLIHLTLGLWFFRFKLSFGFHRLQRFQRTRFMSFFRGFYSLLGFWIWFSFSVLIWIWFFLDSWFWFFQKILDFIPVFLCTVY